MKKLAIRAAILLTVFIAAFVFFYIRLDEASYTEASDVSITQKSVLPLVSFMVNGNEINLTKGYTKKNDSATNRRLITPVSTEKSLTVIIDQQSQLVRRLEATLVSIPDLNEIETQNVQVFETDDEGRRLAPIKFASEMAPGDEYLLRVNLTNSEGNNIFYYTRLMVADFGSLSGSVEYVNNFHNVSYDKEQVDSLKNYMETDENVVVDNYAHIDITASLDVLSYGEMNPTEVYRSVPCISEYNKTYVCAYIDYSIDAYTTNGQETFTCKEEYRFRYTPNRIYLMNFDRYMETVFRADYLSTDRNLKLGITNSPSQERLYSPNGEHFLFVQGDSLYHMDVVNNKITKVHTFYDDIHLEKNGLREYGYNMLIMDDDGNASFAVYGYMSKGSYEGRTGLIYYGYDGHKKELTERMFVPIDMEYADMKDQLLKVSYTSESDVYYFTLFDSLYSYELETGVLQTVVADLGANWLYFEDSKTIVYSENPDMKSNKKLIIRHLVERTEEYIECDSESIIGLIGTVDGRIVYGVAGNSNLVVADDGENKLPFNQVSIVEIDKKVVKEITATEGQCLSGIRIENGLIAYDVLSLEKAAEGDSLAVYNKVNDAVLLNVTVNKTVKDNYVSKLLEKTKTEYYMTMPVNYKGETAPQYYTTTTKMISGDTQVAVDVPKANAYYAFAYGTIAEASDNLGPVINAAKEKNGIVVNERGEVIWRKGIYNESKEIKYNKISVKTAGDERIAIAKMLAGSIGEVLKEEFDPSKASFIDYLKENISPNMTHMTGCDAENLKNFLSEGHPVVATYKGHYVLLISYSRTKLAYYDPTTEKRNSESIVDLVRTLKQDGEEFYIFY